MDVAMNPYYYKRSSRSWVNYLFATCGTICLLLAYFQFRWHCFGNSPHALSSFLSFGVLFLFGGLAGLVVKTEWTMRIDEDRLYWTDGKRNGEILIKEIKKVQVEEGDGRCLNVELNNGVKLTISGECYGDASDLRQWFHKNLGNQLEGVN
jgi:hypothetical protein